MDINEEVARNLDPKFLKERRAGTGCLGGLDGEAGRWEASRRATMAAAAGGGGGEEGSLARRVWRTYLRQLQLHPLRTKMIMSGCLAGVSDSVAQKLSGYQRIEDALPLG
ncbi:hypothetical protein GUJ93_ZPchr0006g45034 [Zizania palustris]|uniref:Uncharacterized protein n=1 Tax=Zizania palustris TaxID=103762 RepID=A0A8J5SYH4_ZIZPA|nr:hypothetical protein GUJ93_ZPchr0006g45034 [Zizania palustris]